MHSLTNLRIFNLNKGFAVRDFTFLITRPHRRIVLALSLTTLLIALLISLLAGSHSKPDNKDILGPHYARLLGEPVAEGNLKEINRILASMVQDSYIVNAAVFTASGERIAYKGPAAKLPQLFRESPQRTVGLLPVVYEEDTLGYLQWVREPNN